jgi:hypothetical protein
LDRIAFYYWRVAWSGRGGSAPEAETDGRDVPRVGAGVTTVVGSEGQHACDPLTMWGAGVARTGLRRVNAWLSPPELPTVALAVATTPARRVHRLGAARRRPSQPWGGVHMIDGCDIVTEFESPEYVDVFVNCFVARLRMVLA